jgi:hypothetical protein
MDVIGLVKNKKFLVIGLIFIFASMVVNFPFPHEYPLGQAGIEVFNIPVNSVHGLHYVGITALLLLLAGLYFYAKSFKKYHGRLIVLAIIVVSLTPHYVADAYQKTFATGIYAISHDREGSFCSFEMTNETNLYAECDIPFENYSSEDVRFTIEFYDKSIFEDEVKMISLLNEGGPYEVYLKGNERQRVKIEANIDVSEIENHVESGEAAGFNLIIKSNGKIRKL